MDHARDLPPPQAVNAEEVRLLRAAVESGLDGMVVVSPEGRMVAFNHQFVQMWPIPAEVVASGSDEAALQSVLDKVVDPDGFLSRVHECYADPTESSRDVLHLRDGRVFDRYGTPLHDRDGTYLGWAWYFRDVTEQHLAAQAALEAGERFAALARTLQDSLLPPHLPDVPGLEVAARYLPAGQGIDVVGDFYDVFQTGEHSWAAAIGDVCGKGVEAAKVTALARYTLRAGAISHRRPSRVLRLLNEAMLRQSPDPERFLTATYVALDQRRGHIRATLGAAGHPPALLRHADGSVDSVGTPGSLLGAFDDPDLPETDLDLVAGDVLVLYTDGVTEARRAGTGELYGGERLHELVARIDATTAVAFAAEIENDIVAFTGEMPSDDTAILVVKVPG